MRGVVERAGVGDGAFVCRTPNERLGGRDPGTTTAATAARMTTARAAPMRSLLRLNTCCLAGLRDPEDRWPRCSTSGTISPWSNVGLRRSRRANSQLPTRRHSRTRSSRFRRSASPRRRGSRNRSSRALMAMAWLPELGSAHRSAYGSTSRSSISTSSSI